MKNVTINFIKSQKLILVYIILSMGFTFISMINPLFTSFLIDSLTMEEDVNKAYLIISLIAIFSILSNLLFYFKDYLKLILNIKLKKRIEDEVLESIHLDNYCFNQNSIERSQRINDESYSVASFILENSSLVITNTLVIVFSCVVLYKINIFFLLVSLVSIPIYLMCLFKMKNSVYLAQSKGKESSAQYRSEIDNQLKITPKIKFDNVKDVANQLFESVYKNYFLTAKRIFNQMYIFYSLDGYLKMIVQIVFFIYGVNLIIYNHMTIGEFTVVLSYYSLIMGSISYFLNLSREYISYSVSLDFLDKQLYIHNENRCFESLSENFQLNHLRIEDFSYSYDDKRILNFSKIKIEGNQLVILKGDNGTGKSTLLKIISSIIPSEKQKYFINDIDTNDINMQEIRENYISYVMQEPILWNLSMKDNIQAYLPDIEDYDEFVYLLKEMNIYNFLMCGEGYDKNDWISNVTALSGGKLKKLALAIEFLKSKRLLLLDEPMNDLDSTSRNELKYFLQNYKKNHIIIVVSHLDNLDSIADMIIHI